MEMQQPNEIIVSTISNLLNFTPEESTLFKGLVCYADVRSDMEDVSTSIAEVLQRLGAKVVKSVTKKVTHVIYKEGKRSTYVAAKMRGVPMVKVLWIEACRRIRGIADPALYPPITVNGYENIMPFQMIKKRRLGFYNRTSKIRKNIIENYDKPDFTPISYSKQLARMQATADKRKAKASIAKDPLPSGHSSSLKSVPSKLEYKTKRVRKPNSWYNGFILY